MGYCGGVCVSHGDGRLGNILFEAATGAYWAKQNGMPYYFQHKFSSEEYPYIIPIKEHFKKINWINGMWDIPDEQYGRGKDYYCITFREVEITSYTEITDMPADYKYPVNVVIEGTRLNPLYFTREFALDVFGATDEDKRIVRELYSDVDLSKCVSVHVRRGDFLDYQTEYVGFNINPRDFYRKIFKLFDDDQRYIIMSEDLDWCRRTFIGPNFIFADRQTDLMDPLLVDLFIPTLCMHNIISCSSFGWWGAYLNETPGRKVFYQQPWYRWSFDYGSGIIPDDDDWIAVDETELNFDDNRCIATLPGYEGYDPKYETIKCVDKIAIGPKPLPAAKKKTLKEHNMSEIKQELPSYGELYSDSASENELCKFITYDVDLAGKKKKDADIVAEHNSRPNIGGEFVNLLGL